MGAAYGTAKSGVGICSMGVMHPGLIMKCEFISCMPLMIRHKFFTHRTVIAAIIPVVMAGVIGIYGFIIAVVVGTKSEFKNSNVCASP